MVPQLASLFFSGGQLHDVQTDVRDAPGQLTIAMHECNLMLHELLSRTTRDESMAKELERLLTEAATETRDGACWAFTRLTVIGRKPHPTVSVVRPMLCTSRVVCQPFICNLTHDRIAL
jgi:hypothetical protein